MNTSSFDPGGTDTKGALRGGNAVIEIDDLHRTYRMGGHDVHALRAVSLRIEEGDFVAIVGASGSGKSTLMTLLGCLDTPTSGSYRLCGQEISRLDDQGLSRIRNREIGFVFQQFFLLPELDVTENIALGMTYAGISRGDRQDAARVMADRVGLSDRLSHRSVELSGGQMQRVAVARALANRPHLILADEPTGNLDSHTGQEILALFEALNDAGTTVVLVTHDPNVAARARRVVTLEDGVVSSDQRQGSDMPPSSVVPRERPGKPFGLRWGDLLNISLREGLLAHKLRSLLTMLGIIFGIAAVIAMTAITEGGKRQQLEQLRQIGMNNIQIRDLDLEAGRLLRQRRVNPRGITLDDMAQVVQFVDGIAAATAWKEIRAEIRHGDRVVEDPGVLGVAGDFEEVVNYHVRAGRFLDDADGVRHERVCVIGPELVEELGMGDDPLGEYLIVGDQPFTIVGVMERKAFNASRITDVSVVNRNREIYLPYEVLRRYFRKDSKDSEIDVISLRMVTDKELVEQSRLVEYIVRDLHYEADDFTVAVPLEKLRQAQQTRDIFNVIIIVIAGISLVVGGIGIMNIMLATVTERTREIGIRRAVGASRRHVLQQFLMEALLIALVGGLLGIVVGVLGGGIIEQVFGFPVAFNPVIMLVATIVSITVGIGFGMYPAWMAANMDPVEALRT